VYRLLRRPAICGSIDGMKNGGKPRFVWCVLLLGLLGFQSVHVLFSRQTWNDSYGYYLDIPEGWEVFDAENLAQVSFTDPEGTGFFQITAYDAFRFSTVRDMADFVQDRLGAQGETAEFRYNNTEAVFADLEFQVGTYTARGYFIFLMTDTAGYALAAYADTSRYEELHDTLLSALDSFAPDRYTRTFPGPVSQFYYPFPGNASENIMVDLGPRPVPFGLDEGEIDASQVLIEREARVLGRSFSPDGQDGLWVDAWKRYYRAVYRDTYQRLAPLVPEVMRHLRYQDIPPEDVPAEILRWLQTYEYQRVGGFSDLQSPVSCVVTASGDCDSLSLVYIILLHHLGYDAILMVSHRFEHALTGVDIPGWGARFEYNGTEWLVAELTDDVDIGLIEQSMADPAGWIGIEFK
jgi:hypothetical protein